MNEVHADHYASHETVALLLPWYVNATLDADERRLVEAHLDVCLTCRLDLGRERRVLHEIREAKSETLAAQHAYNLLRQRLAVPPRRWLVRRLAAFESALTPARLALAASVALLAVAVTFLSGNLPGDIGNATSEYRTLAADDGQTPPGPATLRVVFSADSTDADRLASLSTVAAHIVAGPSPNGVYTVEVSRTAADAAVATLRADSRLVFVEPAFDDRGTHGTGK